MPRVSIVIPTYNRAHIIRETVDSVLAQTYKDFEVIIVDDGSTDCTSDVLAGYSDPRMHIIYQENQGQGSARNTGILAAQGEYIAFLDSDDLWVPTKLAYQIDLFAKHEQLVWAYSDAYAFDGETKQMLYVFGQRSRQYEGHIARQLLIRDFIVTSTLMIQRRVFDEVGLFSDMPKAQDWDLWLRVAAKYPIRKVPGALTGYRIHKSMITQAQDPMFKHQCHVAVIERAVAFAPEIYEPVRQRAMANQCIATGQRLVGQGDMAQARRMFVQAICHSPNALRAYLFWGATLLGRRIVGILVQMYKMRGSTSAGFVTRRLG